MKNERTLIRLKVDQPDFEELEKMKKVMWNLLEDGEKSQLSIEELQAFQDKDGSFKLFESYRIPSDARVDFCFVPTYIGAAVLMKAYLSGASDRSESLERALQASVRFGFSGHGYNAERESIDALNIFMEGGLRCFLETELSICPEFHRMIHSILFSYRSRLYHNCTKGLWGEDYRQDWQNMVQKLSVRCRYYAAYGSNMDGGQMLDRCVGAKRIGKAYIKDWKLTIPFYANIEPAKGKKTPVLLYEINESDEKSLDSCEGYPSCYEKSEVLVNIGDSSREDPKLVSAMVFVMTKEYKVSNRVPRNGYIEQIKNGYRKAGFSDEEFNPDFHDPTSIRHRVDMHPIEYVPTVFHS